MATEYKIHTYQTIQNASLGEARYVKTQNTNGNLWLHNEAVRSKWGTANQVLLIPNGSEVHLLNLTSTTSTTNSGVPSVCAIDYNGKRGYVAEEYLSATKPTDTSISLTTNTNSGMNETLKKILKYGGIALGVGLVGYFGYKAYQKSQSGELGRISRGKRKERILRLR